MLVPHAQQPPPPQQPPASRAAGQLAAYTQLLVVPLMARMSDPLPRVRRGASPTFAALVALLPLAQVCSLGLRSRWRLGLG